MIGTVETAPAPAARNSEIILDFNAERVKAPFFLRCGALLIDYIILISVPVAGLLLGRFMGNDGTSLIGGALNDAAWLVAILLGFSNLIVLPVISGQTIGKMLAGLRIVHRDGRAATKRSIFMRQTLGYLLSILTVGLGFLFCAADKRGRALHDYISGTVLIYADRRTR